MNERDLRDRLDRIESKIDKLAVLTERIAVVETKQINLGRQINLLYGIITAGLSGFLANLFIK